ncbi:trypsin-like peptidase domain-containing protein [Desulfosporosinus lacus]|uniref:Trypsin-like peptidase domain-containing protein n=1 Tax=Desulfosporosinus lacus DSM 15449 TaxID=1121420 RepID=A0A1M5WV53_9FIRM|nr:trypsin-like peptidase domain-containing protein [Desulfosporosinus lacus]SHH91495.1 Trypsin-like peptidase domain-containing protein [Desulfosporosinus lacus DSM 15449]
MIVSAKPLKTILKETTNPLEDFSQVNGNYNNNVYIKEVMLVRYIGINNSIETYIENILNIDRYFSTRMSTFPYLRLHHRLEILSNTNDIKKLSSVWDNWETIINNSFDSHSLNDAFLCTPLENDTLEWTKKLAFRAILLLYLETHPNSNQTLFKNFAIKFMNWIEIYLPKLFYPKITTGISPKVLFIGDIKHQELLFLYFLSRLGCDICYMNPKEDIVYLYPEIEKYSTLHKCSALYPDKFTIPDFIPAPYIKHASIASRAETVSQATIPNTALPLNLSNTKEYSYEMLAGLSISVVMIKVYDNHNDNNILGCGSGVVIHSNGYILTNLHVVTGGTHFSVIFENDTNEYFTNELIKYHPGYDLAIIRVDRNCSPLIVKTDGDLVRGQKIVAIGSPLGLFNSVSDGIVSGFRDINEIPMIQFTAPISNGSSGGALLDMFGRLVGLITAGFDKGQNINLAVPFHIINQFAVNFIEVN